MQFISSTTHSCKIIAAESGVWIKLYEFLSQTLSTRGAATRPLQDIQLLPSNDFVAVAGKVVTISTIGFARNTTQELEALRVAQAEAQTVFQTPRFKQLLTQKVHHVGTTCSCCCLVLQKITQHTCKTFQLT